METRPRPDPHAAVALGLATVFRGRLRLSSGVLEVEPLAVAEGTADRLLLRGFGIGVEDAVGVQPDQDLDGEVFELQLQPHRIVAGVEDEQGLGAMLGQATEQTADLLGGDEVGVLLRSHAPDVCGGYPGVAGEAELGDELVVPSGDDGLPGGVAAWVVIGPVTV